jgi:hypothetical protein
MESALKKSFYYLGVVAALYLFFYYVIPLLFKIVGIALKVILYVTVWAGIAFIIVLFLVHIVKVVRDRY